MTDKNQIIRDAQYRKGLSIAFFNSTNSAIEMLKLHKFSLTTKQSLKIAQETLLIYRDWFLNQHEIYYRDIISNVGLNYDREATIKVIKSTKTIDELKRVWVGLSADERADKEILKAKDEAKGELSGQ